MFVHCLLQAHGCTTLYQIYQILRGLTKCNPEGQRIRGWFRSLETLPK